MREELGKSFRWGSKKQEPGGKNEWGSMSFLKRHGFGRSRSKGSGDAAPTPAIKWSGGPGPEVIKLQREAAKLQKELTAAKAATVAAEEKVARRDNALRERAAAISDLEKQKEADSQQIAALEQAAADTNAELAKERENARKHRDAAGRLRADLDRTVAQLGARDAEVAQLKESAQIAMKKRDEEVAALKLALMAKEEAAFQAERQVQDLEHKHRPKPVQGFVKMLVFAGTGAAAVIASNNGQ